MRLPEVIVFAGPNGSGKSTLTKLAKVVVPYINADDIKRATQCTDLEAAQRAESMREIAIAQKSDFTFETVLSTERNLKLLQKAKAAGYFVRCIYVLTSDVDINVMRVRSRKAFGGHDVPEEKIRSRYYKALALVPALVQVCDVMHLITSHLDTDFDSLASMVAVRKLYPDAVICPPGSPDRKVKDFMGRHAHQWGLSKPRRISLDQVTLMVVVDTRTRQRIGPFAALDEYNLIRFADLAKEYSQTIQLIVVTDTAVKTPCETA